MIRRSQHSLKFITQKKKEHLDSFFEEYQIVVNKYIQKFWNEEKLVSKPGAEQWRTVESWLCGKAMKAAYTQAIQIIKTARDKNKKKIYRAYQRAFAKAKSKGKNWNIVTQKWKEFSEGKTFRQRINTPVFSGNSINLGDNNVTIYEFPKKLKSFDLAIKIGSVWGNRLSLVLPTKKTSYFNQKIQSGFTVRKGIQLRRIDGQYFVNLFLFKENLKPKETGKQIGIDVGIKKLMSTSEGEFIGVEIESKIQKLKRRKRGSKNFKQTCEEIKHYVGEQVNRLDFKNTSLIVVEDLKLQKMNQKGNNSKELRKTLSNWNIKLLFERINHRCEENRVLFASVSPNYTSQRCSNCGEIHKESRNGERYKCIRCGFELDSDHNASINILNRFLNKEFTVPCDTKKSNSVSLS